MEKTIKKSLALFVCFCMLLGCMSSAFAADEDGPGGGGFGGGGFGGGGGAGGPEWDNTETNDSLPVNPYSGPWEWVLMEDASGAEYWALDVVYCANPTVVGGEAIQHLAIYAPAAYMQQNADGSVTVNPNGKVVSSTGVVYTAETAPVLYGNNSGGYGASSVKEVTIGYIDEGIVQVSMETRGSKTTDDDGKYIGQLPVIVADLKAGIRFLKANDGILPGNSNRIVSHGASSGGALSAMLGATGNSPVFESYLEAIGAADATDDIFMALCYCPITNLSTGDAGFEWFHLGNTQYFVFNAMAVDREGNSIENFPVGPKNMHDLGDNVLGGAHEDELAGYLVQWYVNYVQGFGFDLSDDGLSGAYSEDLRDKFIESLETYIARYDELNPDTDQTVEEYLDSIQTEDGWFTYDAKTGTVSINRLTDVVAGYVPRGKMCPSLDSYNYKSNEGVAFVTEDGQFVHFSQLVLDSLEGLLAEQEAGEHPDWTADDVRYIKDLIGDYQKDISEESDELLEIMSPVNYVTGRYEADLAPYFRWQIGTYDGDHGIPAAWLTHNALLTRHPEVNSVFNLVWGAGHGAVEYDIQDMYDYIAGVMVQEDGLDTAAVTEPWSNPYTDVAENDWYYEAVQYAAWNGLMNGAGSTFAPAANTSGTMMVTILACLDGVDTAGGSSWYEEGVAWAAANGVSEGIDLEKDMTREELVVMLYRYAQAKGSDVSVGEGANILSFSDAQNVSEPAVAAMQWACGAGIVEGSNHFLNPGSNVSRAEIATMLMRFCENVK